jgi:catechol 2,3-dioxygenase-like lactoylglutathione lyase family enzyme
VLHSPNVAGAVQFFTDMLGFRVSDWLGDFMCFLRCNSAHHRIVAPGPVRPASITSPDDMTDVDGMMRGISRLRSGGHRDQLGTRRHTAGDNTFAYFVTPLAGFVAEYTAELEHVDFEQHQAQVHAPAPRVMDQWGIGVGGPQTLPHAHPDARLFQPAPVDAMALFEHFPIIWNLSVAIAMESGARIGEIIDMCQRSRCRGQAPMQARRSSWPSGCRWQTG